MEHPENISSKCNIVKNENEKIDIKCEVVNSPFCPIDPEIGVIVGTEEPEPLEIDDSILYFSSFAGKNNVKYSVKIESLFKIEEEKKKNCIYSFGFYHESFNFPLFKNSIPFDIDMYFNGRISLN